MAENSNLIEAIADLREEEVLSTLKQRLEDGEDPLHLFHECQKGMYQVGVRYSREEYFISGLIMADEILRQVIEIISPAIQNQKWENQAQGTVLLGTVENDIHDLGKNIVKMLLSCNGFAVHDLGVDVRPEKFVEELNRIKPDIIGLSCLISSAYDSMEKTIEIIKQETAEWEKKPYIIIGGNQIDRNTALQVGSDYWVNDAMSGVEICKKIVLN